MIIGVPRERKTLEKRVALTPDGVHELLKHGHSVIIETTAGNGSHFTDEQYAKSGASIAKSLAEVWERADLVLKVKEPAPEEYQYFRKGLCIFDYLHLASFPDLTKKMVDSGVTGIAYELVQGTDGGLPLLAPMSEVAGKLSVMNGTYFLLAQNGGRGVLPGGAIGVAPAVVVILGAGVAGRAACEVAVGLGAEVSIFDRDYKKLERIRLEFGSRVRTLHSTDAAVAREAARADLLIGAVLVPGASAPKVIRRGMVEQMQRGSVLVDISIDQGGCAETSKVTSLAEPVFEDFGVIHYGVPNMPAQTPRTSTIALTAATLPYLLRIADMGVEAAITKCPELHPAVNTFNGRLTNKAVSEAVGLPYSEW